METIIDRARIKCHRGGRELLNEIHRDAENVWNKYFYKGQKICEGIPWKENQKEQENKDIPYIDDAIKFTSAFQNVLVLCKAYGAEGGLFYKNQELLQDIINILDFLCNKCYVPKTQTDNWWTWEIGIPEGINSFFNDYF